MSNRFPFRPAAAAGLFVLLGSALPLQPPVEAPDQALAPLALLADPMASDQVWNEGSSTPVVNSSIVQGGPSDGTSGVGVIDADPEFLAARGDDAIVGSLDDDLRPAAQSVAVDAGDPSHLPADRFDLDGDGDTAEPLPVDVSGNIRGFDGGSGTALPDMGAYEVGAGAATAVESSDLPARTSLTPAYPNPARGTVTFELRSASRERARVVIYDILGRAVMTAFDESVTPGHARTVQVATADLASGVYVARLETGSTTVSRRFVVER